jgi:hypothetical protein
MARAFLREVKNSNHPNHMRHDGSRRFYLAVQKLWSVALSSFAKLPESNAVPTLAIWRRDHTTGWLVGCLISKSFPDAWELSLLTGATATPTLGLPVG